MHITAGEVILEEIAGEKHISIEKAFDVASLYVTEEGELDEEIFNAIAQKLTEEEQKLFVAMLTGRGIKVLPFKKVTIKAEEVLSVPESKLEEVKKEILEKVNKEGEISSEKLEEILSKIDDPVLKGRINLWLATTPLVKIRKAKDEYKKRVKRQVKKITGEEAIR